MTTWIDQFSRRSRWIAGALLAAVAPEEAFRLGAAGVRLIVDMHELAGMRTPPRRLICA